MFISLYTAQVVMIMIMWRSPMDPSARNIAAPQFLAPSQALEQQ